MIDTIIAALHALRTLWKFYVLNIFSGVRLKAQRPEAFELRQTERCELIDPINPFSFLLHSLRSWGRSQWPIIEQRNQSKNDDPQISRD